MGHALVCVWGARSALSHSWTIFFLVGFFLQVKLLFAVLTLHVRAGAECRGAVYLCCIALPYLQVKLLFAVLTQHVRAGAECRAAVYFFAFTCEN